MIKATIMSMLVIFKDEEDVRLRKELETVRREFKDSTVVTIAHRLDTVLDNDRVMVMEEGRVVECGPPGRLAQDPDSVFYKMERIMFNGMIFSQIQLAFLVKTFFV